LKRRAEKWEPVFGNNDAATRNKAVQADRKIGLHG
jgi:hypothetical protein